MEQLQGMLNALGEAASTHIEELDAMQMPSSGTWYNMRATIMEMQELMTDNASLVAQAQAKVDAATAERQRFLVQLDAESGQVEAADVDTNGLAAMHVTPCTPTDALIAKLSKLASSLSVDALDRVAAASRVMGDHALAVAEFSTEMKKRKRPSAPCT